MTRYSPPNSMVFSKRCGVFSQSETVRERLERSFSLKRFALIKKLSLDHSFLEEVIKSPHQLKLVLETDSSIKHSILYTVIGRIEAEVKGDNKNGTKANFEMLDFISTVDGIPDNIKNACESARHSLERYFLDYRCTPK